ncbi:MAG: glycine zipper 2TM domain-containing protein [Bdellovibrionales bacterium]|nr:glycine zipper 2TM domain-containing protein [Ramlibacter sp.]
MKRFALIALLAATAAAGANAQTFIDYARVRSVDPQFETIQVPRNVCTNEVFNETRAIGGERQYGGAVIGGLAGGVLGNQVGRGSGRSAATALGVVLGAVAGDRIGNRNQFERYENVPREVQTCRTVNDVQQRPAGFRVSYDYRGQQYTTVLPNNPGPNLQVRVSVEPVVQ